MRLCRITGTVTSTAKDSSLVGGKLLLGDVVDSSDGVLESSHVVLDSCGAGVGDLVLVAFGSASRLPSSASSCSVDATAIAVIDEVKLN